MQKGGISGVSRDPLFVLLLLSRDISLSTSGLVNYAMNRDLRTRLHCKYWYVYGHVTKDVYGSASSHGQ